MAYDKNTDYTALINKAVEDGDYAAAAQYEQQRNEKVADMNAAGTNTQGYKITSDYAQFLNTPASKPSQGSGTGGQVPTTIPQYSYDASSNEAYMNVLGALQQAQGNKPTYAGTYDSDMRDLYDKIVNRDKFQYDLNGDMLYQQYKDGYVNMGQMAMKDAMGQAAALTGGYGSSYGQSVGQQQYDAYLQQLNDVVPELYGMALNQYNAEGDRLMQQYGMLGDLRDEEYGRYMDELNRYWQDVTYLQEQADTAYNRGYENWYNAQQMQFQAEQEAYDREQDAYLRQLQADQIAYDREQDAYLRGQQEDEIAYGRQQDAYDRLLEMILTMGYKPTAEELATAGMSDAQYQAWHGYYTAQNTPTVYTGGGGGGPNGGDEKPNFDAVSNEVLNKMANGEHIYDISSYILAQDKLSTEEKQELLADLSALAVDPEYNKKPGMGYRD